MYTDDTLICMADELSLAVAIQVGQSNGEEEDQDGVVMNCRRVCIRLDEGGVGETIDKEIGKLLFVSHSTRRGGCGQDRQARQSRAIEIPSQLSSVKLRQVQMPSAKNKCSKSVISSSSLLYIVWYGIDDVCL